MINLRPPTIIKACGKIAYKRAHIVDDGAQEEGRRKEMELMRSARLVEIFLLLVRLRVSLPPLSLRDDSVVVV